MSEHTKNQNQKQAHQSDYPWAIKLSKTQLNILIVSGVAIALASLAISILTCTGVPLVGYVVGVVVTAIGTAYGKEGWRALLAILFTGGLGAAAFLASTLFFFVSCWEF